MNAIYYDDYGNAKVDKWNRELDYFYENVIKPNLDEHVLIEVCAKTGGHGKEAIKHYIDQQIYGEPTQPQYKLLHDDYHASMSGEQYEIFCSAILNDAGWETQMTDAAGDFGVDVLATKRGTSIAFQCKRYKSNVGVSAVQEILGGKAYVNANYAAVVSNADYTAAAKELASKTGVMLLHHRQLAQVESLL